MLSLEDEMTKNSFVDDPEEFLPPLEYEIDPDYKLLGNFMGRRIVDLAHVLKEYQTVVTHPIKCTMGRMKFIKETRVGLVSNLHFHCDNCNKTFIVSTEPPGKSVNNAVVWGSLSTGIGHNQCEELFAVLNIPFMTSKTFSREVVKVKNGRTDRS